MKGSVEIFLNKSDGNSTQTFKNLKVLFILYQNSIKFKQKGDVFGEFSFFTQTPRDFSCRSMEFTTVLTIKRSDALKIFKENEEDYERFCHIKDKILLEKDYSVLNFRCFYCRSLKHNVCDCPSIHYVPDIEKIIKRHEFYEETPRKFVKRRNRHRFPKTEIIIDAKCFQEKDQKTVSTSKMNQYDEISQISEESHKNNECSEEFQ